MSVGTKLAAGGPPDGPRNSFDQLDRLVRVTTIHGWVYLATLFAVCTGGVRSQCSTRSPPRLTAKASC